MTEIVNAKRSECGRVGRVNTHFLVHYSYRKAEMMVLSEKYE